MSARPDHLMTIREVCQQTGVGRSRVRAWVQAGQFPQPVKLGTSVRWSEREVQAWIEARLDDRDQQIAAAASADVTDFGADESAVTVLS